MERKSIKDCITLFTELSTSRTNQQSKESATAPQKENEQHRSDTCLCQRNGKTDVECNWTESSSTKKQEESKPNSCFDDESSKKTLLHSSSEGLDKIQTHPKTDNREQIGQPDTAMNYLDEPVNLRRDRSASRESGYETPLSNHGSVVEISKQDENEMNVETVEYKVESSSKPEYNTSSFEVDLKIRMENLIKKNEKESLDKFLTSLKSDEKLRARKKIESILSAFLKEEGFSKAFSVTLTSKGYPPSHSFVVMVQDREYPTKYKKDWITFLHKRDVNMESRGILAHESGNITPDEIKMIEEFNNSQSEYLRNLSMTQSNLNSISISKGKSIDFGRSQWILTDEMCVVLHCFHKGYIPYGESSFPSKIGNYRTDVREGFCEFSTKINVQMGKAVYTESNQMVSSVGNFVGTNDGSTAFITCAHAILALRKLTNDSSLSDFTGVKIYDLEKREPIGKVAAVAFEYNAPESVDAVVVELNDDAEGIQGFPTIQMSQLQHAGFLNQSYSISSETLEVTNCNKRWHVVKYGATSQFTVGSLQFGGIHAKMCDMDFYESITTSDASRSENGSLWMSNQYLVNPVGQKEFLLQGDSGSFVYMVDEQERTLKCIGMLIGQTSCGQGIMTPINRILNRLNISGLKQFGQPASIQTDNRNQEMALLNAVQSSLTLVVNEMKNLQVQMSDLRCDVKGLKSDVAKLQTEHMDTT